jgi:hypothetical protein
VGGVEGSSASEGKGGVDGIMTPVPKMEKWRGKGGGKSRGKDKEQSQRQSQDKSNGHCNQILTTIWKSAQDSSSYGATSNKGRGGNLDVV